MPDSKKLVSVEVASLQERIIQLCLIAPKRQMLGKGEAVRKIDDEPAMAAMESLDNIRWTADSTEFFNGIDPKQSLRNPFEGYA